MTLAAPNEIAEALKNALHDAKHHEERFLMPPLKAKSLLFSGA